jgi:hypothetical protein
MATRKRAKDTFEQLCKDMDVNTGWGGGEYQPGNGGQPCYITDQDIPDKPISDANKRRYIALCRDAQPVGSLLEFSVTAKEKYHKEWLNVFTEYMDEGASLIEAKSIHGGRYKVWLFIIHAKKMK